VVIVLIEPELITLEYQAMSIQTIMNCGLILIGAIILLASIVRVRRLMRTMPSGPEPHRKQSRLFLVMQRELLLFFLIGYIAVMVAFAFRYSLVSEVLLSLIFLCGAIFAYLGTVVQSRLLAETQNPLQGTLSICTECRKIRVEDKDYNDPENWKEIESYISEKSKVTLSPGYCPECFTKEMKEIGSDIGKT